MPENAALTYADLASFPDDGLRRELIDGELIVTPAPRLRHQRISGRLYVVFATHLATHGGGEVFYAPVDVLFSDTNVLEPDLLFVPDDQADILTEMNVQGAPPLVIEVLSNPRIDRVRKRDVYARFSVPEYWVVDPDADRIEVYKPREGAYRKPEIVEPGEMLTYARLPGLEIDLAQLFARLRGVEDPLPVAILIDPLHDILWADAELESIAIDYDQVVFTLTESTARTVKLKCLGHIGLLVEGFWDEQVIVGADLVEAHPFADRCMSSLRERHGDDLPVSGSPDRNTSRFRTLVVSLTDGGKILCTAARFEASA